MEERALELLPLESRSAGLVKLVDSPQAIKEAWDQFQALKLQLLEPHDYHEVQGKNYIKKSGYRKLAAAFGVSVERITEEREQISNDAWLWRFVVRASAPNGRFADGVAICASNERRMAHPEHDTYSTAYTRAANRAIADLIGGGEVSAEEMDGAGMVSRAAPPRRQQTPYRPEDTRHEPVDPDGPLSDAQLRNITQHLTRTGITADALAAQAGVGCLEELTRELAAEALRRLSREPNAS